MIFVQEAGQTSQTLRFGPQRLVVAIADAAGARELSLPYYDIDLDSASTFRASPPFGRWALAAGAALAAGLALYSGSYAGAAGALAAAAFALWRRKAALAGTQFGLRSPRRRGQTLTVWRDAQHDRILAELSVRWKDMRREIVRVDFDAAPEAEAARFVALRDRGVVTTEECAAAIARIEAKAAARLEAQ